MIQVRVYLGTVWRWQSDEGIQAGENPYPKHL
jgi:hypothetical protein